MSNNQEEPISATEFELQTATSAESRARTWLIYVKEGPKEPRQEELVQKAKDFIHGLWIRREFRSIDELAGSVRKDLLQEFNRLIQDPNMPPGTQARLLNCLAEVALEHSHWQEAKYWYIKLKQLGIQTKVLRWYAIGSRALQIAYRENEAGIDQAIGECIARQNMISLLPFRHYHEDGDLVEDRWSLEEQIEDEKKGCEKDLAQLFFVRGEIEERAKNFYGALNDFIESRRRYWILQMDEYISVSSRCAETYTRLAGAIANSPQKDAALLNLHYALDILEELGDWQRFGEIMLQMFIQYPDDQWTEVLELTETAIKKFGNDSSTAQSRLKLLFNARDLRLKKHDMLGAISTTLHLARILSHQEKYVDAEYEYRRAEDWLGDFQSSKLFAELQLDLGQLYYDWDGVDTPEPKNAFNLNDPQTEDARDFLSAADKCFTKCIETAQELDDLKTKEHALRLRERVRRLIRQRVVKLDDESGQKQSD